MPHIMARGQPKQFVDETKAKFMQQELSFKGDLLGQDNNEILPEKFLEMLIKHNQDERSINVPFSVDVVQRCINFLYKLLAPENMTLEHIQESVEQFCDGSDFGIVDGKQNIINHAMLLLGVLLLPREYVNEDNSKYKITDILNDTTGQGKTPMVLIANIMSEMRQCIVMNFSNKSSRFRACFKDLRSKIRAKGFPRKTSKGSKDAAISLPKETVLPEPEELPQEIERAQSALAEIRTLDGFIYGRLERNFFKNQKLSRIFAKFFMLFFTFLLKRDETNPNSNSDEDLSTASPRKKNVVANAEISSPQETVLPESEKLPRDVNDDVVLPDFLSYSSDEASASSFSDDETAAGEAPNIPANEARKKSRAIPQKASRGKAGKKASRPRNSVMQAESNRLKSELERLKEEVTALKSDRAQVESNISSAREQLQTVNLLATFPPIIKEIRGKLEQLQTTSSTQADVQLLAQIEGLITTALTLPDDQKTPFKEALSAILTFVQNAQTNFQTVFGENNDKLTTFLKSITDKINALDTDYKRQLLEATGNLKAQFQNLSEEHFVWLKNKSRELRKETLDKIKKQQAYFNLKLDNFLKGAFTTEITKLRSELSNSNSVFTSQIGDIRQTFTTALTALTSKIEELDRLLTEREATIKSLVETGENTFESVAKAIERNKEAFNDTTTALNTTNAAFTEAAEKIKKAKDFEASIDTRLKEIQRKVAPAPIIRLTPSSRNTLFAKTISDAAKFIELAHKSGDVSPHEIQSAIDAYVDLLKPTDVLPELTNVRSTIDELHDDLDPDNPNQNQPPKFLLLLVFRALEKQLADLRKKLAPSEPLERNRLFLRFYLETLADKMKDDPRDDAQLTPKIKTALDISLAQEKGAADWETRLKSDVKEAKTFAKLYNNKDFRTAFETEFIKVTFPVMSEIVDLGLSPFSEEGEGESKEEDEA